MVDLPKKKAGIVACSGEELPEGTVTRLAALQVLEKLRPSATVTICLPLFLAGGEGDRLFARFYPTIAVDGCALRCAGRATEMFSGRPAANIVVTELAAEFHLGKIEGRRTLNEAGRQAVELVAERVSEKVDEVLQQKWDRHKGEFISQDPAISRSDLAPAPVEIEASTVATCTCGSGIPVQKVSINGQIVSLIALPLIFDRFYLSGKTPCENTTHELLEMVKIYNPVPYGCEEDYAQTIQHEYQKYCEFQKVTS